MNDSRRKFLINAGLGLGGAAAAAGFIPGVGFIGTAMASDLADPLAPKSPHFAGKVKSVIWLHMKGAPSSLDLFDYKPELIRLAGQDVPASFLKGLKTFTQGGVGKLYAANNRNWKQHGESGAWFSDLLPSMAKQVDKMAFIRSSVTVGATHDISILKLNTGDLNPGRPSLGAWVNYALGSANRDLPSYVVLYNGMREPDAGAVNWSSGFLPAVYQGTAFRPGDSPIVYLDRPELRSVSQQRNSLDLLNNLDRLRGTGHTHDTELQARLRSYELAERMQLTAPEAVDLKGETAATKALYGLDDSTSEGYGATLLRARRLVERGVRFVQVVSAAPDNRPEGAADDWDAHHDLEGNHGLMSRMVDKPVAGLLADLESRGLLESTLVVWASEFGRSPWSESGTGRDHNAFGYSQWIAGGGVKAGSSYGETDAIGLKVTNKDDAVDTYDLHATVLHLLGLDHLKVTYLNNGRSERPTVVYGRVVDELLA